VNSKSLELKTS